MTLHTKTAYSVAIYDNSIYWNIDILIKNMHNEDREEIEEIVKLINNSVDENTFILVEGKSDIEALREAGIKAKIYTLYDFYKLADSFSLRHASRVVVLLDLDREGELILRRLKNKYSNTVKFDEFLRKRLRTTDRYKRGLRTIYQLFTVTNRGIKDV